MLLAYAGPETVLPLTSVAAGALGVVLMFGRVAIRFLGRTVAAARGAIGGTRPGPRGRSHEPLA